MRTAAVWLVLAAAAAGCGPAMAGAGAVRPPASLDARGIDDWRLANIEPQGWVLLHADASALTYGGGGAGVTADKDGFVHADVRREYYRPVRLGPQASRSNLQSWMLDCEGRRVRVTAMNFYALNNMKGGGFRKAAEDAVWTAVDPSAAPVFERICAAAPRASTAPR